MDAPPARKPAVPAAPDRRRTLRHVADLVEAGLVPEEKSSALEAVARRYAVSVTPAMAALIEVGVESDPIARQFVPDIRERITTAEERADPIGDEAHSPVPGIVHRYPDRVLLKPLHACPVYCRFCFRRETVGPGGEALDGPALEAALAYIDGNPEIWEVILSGGDPLLLSARRLRAVMDALDAMPHVGVIRLHSRIPVVDPARITPEIVSILDRSRTAVWLAVHVNHARELTEAVRMTLRQLARAGVSLVSQTVLLRGINDDAATLEALFRALVRTGVKPYYLHHGDLAPGTSHFRTTVAQGKTLMRALRGRVSGLCQPTYVLDLPGGYGKIPLGPTYIEGGDDTEGWTVIDVHGDRHTYPPRTPEDDPVNPLPLDGGGSGRG